MGNWSLQLLCCSSYLIKGFLMGILFWGLALFCSAFLFHLIVWRVHKPKRQTKILLLLFSCTFIVGTLALCGISSLAASFSLFPLTNVIEYFHLLLFFTTLTLGYVVTYSAIEADSPSLIMVSIIANEGSGGVDEKKFTRLL